MHTLTEHPIDAGTKQTAFAFLDRAAKAFPVKGAVLSQFSAVMPSKLTRVAGSIVGRQSENQNRDA